ncbi:MAG: hypothetical protein IJP68_01120 [Selenomonadaceae bacterium]|nr:hypothetical protein [Selenomonadaceae bacterium]
MNQPLARSNPVAIVAALMARGLTVTEGAKTAGLDRVTFDAAIKTAKPVTVKTASKLVAAFGDDAVTKSTPAQLQLQQLEALREEFADRYPHDAARLDVLDAMIRDARAEIEGGN